MQPNVVLSATGRPKSGKNHLAYTAPDPIKVYCFNGGAEYVATKFPNKVIDVHNFVLPIVESETDEWALPVWAEFYAEYNKDIASGNYKTVVFDTGTEVEAFCRQATLEEIREVKPNKQKLATNEYLARNLRMNALFARARNSGVNLITLQYLREQWVKSKGSDRAEPTGEMILDGWSQTEAQADINVEMEAKIKAGKTIMVATIKSNRFDRTVNEKQFDDVTFDEIMATVLEEV